MHYNDDMNKLDFQLLGLDGRDVRIYKSLLENGPSSIRSVANASGVNRGSTYESLKRLASSGLVSYQKTTSKNRHFVAEPPERFTSLIEEKADELKNLRTKIKPYLQTLQHTRDTSFSLPSRLYEGDEGVAALLRDVLETTENIDPKMYRAISSATLRKYMYKRFPSFTKYRLEKGIFVRVIALGEGGEPTDESERKWLNVSPSDNHAYTIIYGTKVAIISITDLNIPHGIVIDDPAIANVQSLLFEQLWSKIK